MNTQNETKNVSIVNGKIVITYGIDKEFVSISENNTTEKLMSNNSIVDRCLYNPIRKGLKNPIIPMDTNRKKDNSRPLTLTEFTLKGFKLPLDLITENDITLIKSNSIDQIQIRNVIIPIHKGTLDLRVWISRKEQNSINIDDKQTTVSKLYNEQQKEIRQKELRHTQYLKAVEKKKNGYVKSIVSSKDILSLNLINHIGTQKPLPAIDLWVNKALSVNDDTQKYACAYLTLNNHKLNYEKVMNDELRNFLNTHKSRVITAIDNKRLELINKRKVDEINDKKTDMELTTYALTQKSNYSLKIHVCTEYELTQISYTKYLNMEQHLNSMAKTNSVKAKHNMHN